MTTYGPGDLAIVIPTRDRWDVLSLTLDALSRFVPIGGRTGADVIVVVDGVDQQMPPDSGPARFVRVARGGPGAARNHGVELTDRPLILFLGDDIIPEPSMVGRHLAAHSMEPDIEVAILGGVIWHSSVSTNRANRWLDRTGMQFDYKTILPGADATWPRFYSCNVSLKRALFRKVAGFDPSFVYYYEDLDAGWRLAQHGMILRYDPLASGNHLHRYDLERLKARFAGVAVGERMMAEKHDWFTPWFEPIFREALSKPAVSRFWTCVPEVDGRNRLSRGVAARSDLWLLQQIAPSFLSAWTKVGSPS